MSNYDCALLFVYMCVSVCIKAFAGEDAKADVDSV